MKAPRAFPVLVVRSNDSVNDAGNCYSPSLAQFTSCPREMRSDLSALTQSLSERTLPYSPDSSTHTGPEDKLSDTPIVGDLVRVAIPGASRWKARVVPRRPLVRRSTRNRTLQRQPAGRHPCRRRNPVAGRPRPARKLPRYFDQIADTPCVRFPIPHNHYASDKRCVRRTVQVDIKAR